MSNSNITNLDNQENLESEFVQYSQHFNFYELPNCSELGITNAAKSIENISIIVDKAKKAYEEAFYIEFISLKIQYLDFFLRMYYVRKNNKGKIFSSDDKRGFGRIINDCKQLGFDANLAKSLIDFNEQRINAIHKFLLGDFDEMDFILICEKYRTLGNTVKNYVVSEIVILISDVKNLPNSVGSMMFSIPK